MKQEQKKHTIVINSLGFAEPDFNLRMVVMHSFRTNCKLFMLFFILASD